MKDKRKGNKMETSKLTHTRNTFEQASNFSTGTRTWGQNGTEMKAKKTPSRAANRNSKLKNTPGPSQVPQLVFVIDRNAEANKQSYSEERRREAAAEAAQARFAQHVMTAKDCRQTLTLILQTDLF